MALNLPVQTATVPANFCWSGWNSPSWNEIVSGLSVDFPDDVAPINYGSDTPAPDRRDRPWFKLNSDGSPDRWYVYLNGNWVSRHAQPPGSVIMYEGTQASIATFDGGEAAAVTAISGPFWEEVTQAQARSPIGPGVLPSGATIVVGQQTGEEKHILTVSEMPAHQHDVVVDNLRVPGNGSSGAGAGWTEKDTPPTKTIQTASAGSGTPFSIIHPAYGIFLIRRTARMFYRA